MKEFLEVESLRRKFIKDKAKAYHKKPNFDHFTLTRLFDFLLYTVHFELNLFLRCVDDELRFYTD